jgi:anti-sigma B factor antagonist
VELTLRVDYEGPAGTLLVIGGEVDVYSAPKLREKITALIDAGMHRLILDIEGVEFLDSTGLGVLVGGLKRVRAHDGFMDIVCTRPRILRVLRISGLSEVFGIYNTVGDALAAHAVRSPLPTT